jgi:hypothetical protein
MVDLVMAQLYESRIKLRLPGPADARGLLYGSAVWRINALIVFPLSGEKNRRKQSPELLGDALVRGGHCIACSLFVVD